MIKIIDKKDIISPLKKIKYSGPFEKDVNHFKNSFNGPLKKELNFKSEKWVDPENLACLSYGIITCLYPTHTETPLKYGS